MTNINNTVIIAISNRLANIYDDELYKCELKKIIVELVNLCGPLVSGADYPVLATGQGWRLKFGVPKNHQAHYIEFDDPILANFYLLKYAGVIVDTIVDINC